MLKVSYNDLNKTFASKGWALSRCSTEYLQVSVKPTAYHGLFGNGLCPFQWGGTLFFRDEGDKMGTLAVKINECFQLKTCMVQEHNHPQSVSSLTALLPGVARQLDCKLLGAKTHQLGQVSGYVWRLRRVWFGWIEIVASR
ncbi:unnamed protein product [Haemonchus placei]|uniref:TDP43_N domain-containing protein n=1 Tax=Haemonchus placei TaxID=6290 RepID=A0A0N4X799_HAEPC|nr:unnamed protein product [Haemonchus placei]